MEFEHLVLYSQKLALAVVDAPKIVLPILDKAAKEAVLEDWPEFVHIHSEIFVRFPPPSRSSTPSAISGAQSFATVH